jgi:pimeloyl-ACP methyl ester carboxylesterase
MAAPAPSYPGAVAPERSRDVESLGIRIRLHEWGDPERTPVVLCHGMFDHARGFDTLAPLLAERFRVVGVDARGHGDSGWADAYTWLTDLADLANVLRDLGRPAHLVGHSKGGGQATDAACHLPELVRQVANLDGFGPPPEGFRPPGFELDARSLPERFADFLDRRRADEERAWRAYPSLDDLVARRRRMNPRLSEAWLRYFLFHAAREVEGGFVWKVDPLAAGGFGPWKPEWIAPFWRRLRAPLLAVTGSEPDSWGPLPEALLRERLAYVPRLERATVEGAGHFVHMERPRETAVLLLAWLER